MFMKKSLIDIWGVSGYITTYSEREKSVSNYLSQFVKNQPFGAAYYNGMNFVKSVNDPTSRLARTLKYIRDEFRKRNYDITKRDIIEKCWGKNIDERTGTQLINGQWKYWTYDTSRGYGSSFFSTAIKCGFLRKSRHGNKVYYGWGPKAHLVKLED